MNVLILAPQPFYQERGTPISIDLLVRALTERGDNVDLLTFQEGESPVYDNFKIHRIKPWPDVKKVRPGLSAKKIYCDIFLFFRFIGLMRKNKYDIVHAVEESAFMALIICPLMKKPFVFDIDSSMTTQIVDQMPKMKPFRRFLAFFESLPMRYAKAVVPMCDALAEDVRKYRDEDITIIKDVSLLGSQKSSGSVEDLRKTWNLSGKIIMYIGNLESYQGIDLLLQSFSLASKKYTDISLFIIGGSDEDIKKYKDLSAQLGIAKQVHLLGPRPVGQIGEYMTQANILVSPRTQGLNTPMKIYSYLDSGVVVLATRLPTHTQVMSDDVALLADPEPDCFSQALMKLIMDEALCAKLAVVAKELIQREHSYPVFRAKIHDLYTRLDLSR